MQNSAANNGRQLVYIAAAVSVLGGMLFGYGIGVISGAILFIKNDFSLSSGLEEIVVSSVLLGSLCGALAGGSLADRLGRRRLLIGTAIVFGSGAIGAAFNDIRQSAAQQKAHWSELLNPLLRAPMIVGIGLAIAQQITGINTVIYYAPTIFRAAGMSSASVAILASVGVGVVNVALTLVAMQLIDRVGRRPLLLVSLSGMALSLVALGLAFALPQLSGSLGWIAVASLMIYVGSFAVGLGPVLWLILSEIYPLRIRGRAMSIGTAANWVANLIVALSFLTLTKVLGKPTTFWLYAAVSVGSWRLPISLCRKPRERALKRSKPSGGRRVPRRLDRGGPVQQWHDRVTWPYDRRRLAGRSLRQRSRGGRGTYSMFRAFLRSGVSGVPAGFPVRGLKI